jgi:proline racemase
VPSSKNDILVQFSHGGVCYEVVDAKRIGIAVVLTNIQAFVKLAGDVKALIIDGALESSVRHEVYGIVFFEDEHSDMNHLDDVLRERRITVFADGQVDRLPCGSGICARLAIHYMDRRIRLSMEASQWFYHRYTLRRECCARRRCFPQIPRLHTANKSKGQSGRQNELLP